LTVFHSRLETEGEKREVWRLYLENASSDIYAEEKEREQRMYRDVWPIPLAKDLWFITRFRPGFSNHAPVGASVLQILALTCLNTNSAGQWPSRTKFGHPKLLGFGLNF